VKLAAAENLSLSRAERKRAAFHRSQGATATALAITIALAGAGQHTSGADRLARGAQARRPPASSRRQARLDRGLRFPPLSLAHLHKLVLVHLIRLPPNRLAALVSRLWITFLDDLKLASSSCGGGGRPAAPVTQSPTASGRPAATSTPAAGGCRARPSRRSGQVSSRRRPRKTMNEPAGRPPALERESRPCCGQRPTISSREIRPVRACRSLGPCFASVASHRPTDRRQPPLSTPRHSSWCPLDAAARRQD
jgi:hypothetical protein